MDCAVKTNLPDGSHLNPATKLALMAFADSADRHTHIAFPGLDTVMVWAGVSKSRANELVRELVDKGLLLKHKGGHRGRRAEYVVFPNGCCSDCRPPALLGTSKGPTISGAEDAPEGPETPSVSERPATSAPESDPTPSTGPIGYDVPDSVSGEGYGQPHPNGPDPTPAPIGCDVPDPIAEKGYGKGAVAAVPLPSFQSIPPNPQAPPGGAICAKHPKAAHPNCRGCGTTARQIRDSVISQDRAAKRERDIERRRAEQAAVAAAAADSKTPAVQQVIKATRAVFTGGAA